MDIKKFRVGRQLASSVICVVIGIIFMRGSLKGSINDHLIFQVLFTIVAAGIFYCAFGLSQFVLKIICKNGFIRDNPILNIILDTLLYLALAAGAIFLFEFLTSLIIWIGLVLAVGGAIHVYLDIRTIANLDLQQDS